MNKTGKITLVAMLLNIVLLAALIIALAYIAFGQKTVSRQAGPALPGEGGAEVMGGAGADNGDLQAWIDNMKALAQKHGVDAYFLQELFPNQIVYSFRGQHVYAEVDESLPMHSYDWAGLSRSPEGLYTYSETGGRQGIHGIDVSKYQGNIDWQRVKADGVGFAFLRAGYRGYESGEIVPDEFFAAYLEGATAAGIPTGVYFFSQAVNTEEAVAEADYILDAIAGYEVRYPIVFDMEDMDTSPYRTENLSPAEVTDIALAFCARVRERGYTPMVYGNVSWFLARMELHRLNDVDKWFAQYRPMPWYPYSFTIWQYSHKGSVDGIEGEVDLNISFVDYAA